MWPVYLLNMQDDAVRLGKCCAALDALGIEFERFEAINGRALSLQQVTDVYDQAANEKRFRHRLVPSEIGVYLSSRALWQKIANGPNAGAIILEDDFAAVANLAKVLDALSENSGDWDIAKLYTRRPNKKMLSRAPLCHGHEIAQPFQVPNAMLGYAIRRQAAAHLVANKARFFRPVDEDLRHFWEHGLKILLVLPPPLTQGEESQIGSTIEAARKAKKEGSRILQGWKNLRYRINYLTKLYFYRMIRR
jgi:glycosyl transferase, family 25